MIPTADHVLLGLAKGVCKAAVRLKACFGAGPIGAEDAQRLDDCQSHIRQCLQRLNLPEDLILSHVLQMKVNVDVQDDGETPSTTVSEQEGEPPRIPRRAPVKVRVLTKIAAAELVNRGPSSWAVQDQARQREEGDEEVHWVQQTTTEREREIDSSFLPWMRQLGEWFGLLGSSPHEHCDCDPFLLNGVVFEDDDALGGASQGTRGRGRPPDPVGSALPEDARREGRLEPELQADPDAEGCREPSGDPDVRPLSTWFPLEDWVVAVGVAFQRSGHRSYPSRLGIMGSYP